MNASAGPYEYETTLHFVKRKKMWDDYTQYRRQLLFQCVCFPWVKGNWLWWGASLFGQQNNELSSYYYYPIKHLCWQAGHKPSQYSLYVRASCHLSGWIAIAAWITMAAKRRKKIELLKLSCLHWKWVLSTSFTVNFWSQDVSPQLSKVPALERHIIC